MEFSQNEDIRQIDDTDLAVFEKHHGIHLPSDYKEFLKTHRGGFTRKDWAPVEDDGDWISRFFGLSSETDWKTLDYGIQEIGPPSKAGFLAVAVSNGGNYFLLKLSDHSSNPVLFLDHELEGSDPTTFLNLKRVSDSFSAFLDKLEDPDEPQTG